LPDYVTAQGSRAEEGCLRFDVLRDQTDPCKFFFYEVYVDAAAVAVHKEQPVNSFLEVGSVVESVVGPGPPRPSFFLPSSDGSLLKNKKIEPIYFKHFALWTNFKESGGVVKSTSYKTDGLFMT
jgi:hypothetical protein